MKLKSFVCAVIVGGTFALSALPASAFGPLNVNGVDSNQNAIQNAVSRQDAITNTGFPTFITLNFLSPLGLAITGPPLNQLPANQQLIALSQLSPEQFHSFASSLAFNNATFEVTAMDSYLAGLREGASGNFFGSNGRFDVSGLSVSDADVDPALSVVHSRMVAWNAAPFSNGLLDDSSQSLFGGTDMKDSKDMKSMAPPAYEDPWHFFVRGNVVLAQGFSNQDVSHFDENTSSVVLGTDYRITPHFLVGITASFAHSDVTLDTQGSSATVDSYSPGLYAAYADNGWYANFVGDYLHNAYTQSRVITFLGNTANSAPEGNEGVANIDGGYDFHCGALKYGPLAGLAYTHLTVDGYQESGSPLADLTVQDDQADSLRSRLGGHLSYTLTFGGINVTPHLEAAWQHEFMDQARGITSSLASGGGDFSVVTPNPSRDSAIIDVGVDADINRTVSVFVDYLAQAGQENYFGESVQAGVKIGF